MNHLDLLKKLMKFLVFILLLSVTFQLKAQQVVNVYFNTKKNTLFQEEVEPHFLLGDAVAFRTQPNKTSTLISRLTIGTELILMEKSELLDTINGIASPWYFAEINSTKGWIWGGNIAARSFRSTEDTDVIFLTGFAGYKSIGDQEKEYKYLHYSVKAVKNQKLLDKVVVPCYSQSIYEVHNLGNKGLKNIDDILSIHIPCEGGCGCTTGNVYFLYRNGKFDKPLFALGSADADYSSGEYVYFPSDIEGKKDFVVLKTSYVVEEDANSQDRVKRGVKVEYLRWNGSKLVPSTRKTEQYEYVLEYDY